MARVRWSKQAREDVRAIRAFLAHASPAHAHLVETALLNAAQRLEAFPRSGRAVAETNDPAMRELVLRQYRIVYLVDEDDDVFILTVFHSARPLG